MKAIKLFVILALCALLTFSLVACGDKSTDTDTSSSVENDTSKDSEIKDTGVNSDTDSDVSSDTDTDNDLNIDTDTDILLSYIKKDKKASGDKITVCLVENIGEYILKEIYIEDLRKIIEGGRL